MLRNRGLCDEQQNFIFISINSFINFYLQINFIIYTKLINLIGTIHLLF